VINTRQWDRHSVFPYSARLPRCLPWPPLMSAYGA